MDKYEVKIKCGSCNKNKSKGMFSNTAFKKWQQSSQRHARDPKQPVKTINCMACSSGNREELECSMCSRVMALEKFSKFQRKKNDDALCLDCSQEKQDREAEHAKEVQEIEIIEEMKREGSVAESHRTYSARMSSSHRSQVDSANDRLETETNPSSEDWALGNDAVSLVSSGSSSNKTRPTTGTGWDQYNGVKRTTAASSGSNSGFARQNAVPQDPHKKAFAQLEREMRRAQEQEEVVRDGSDDDSDDGIDPY